ncbi:MAG: HipA domain-containing protein [Ignavibacteriales bacterium]|nr:HipA domain-containing protein [Ignavibacteriales bacterium]MCB9258419.1 HipA domain-containing protein [Ignavibacteriales bacterium]
MNVCPITYQKIEKGKYSIDGLKLLSRNLDSLNNLAYTKEEQLQEAAARATKLSIQGVQPKLSAKLNVKQSSFELVDKGGTFILKPQNILFSQLPENEDLTMRLASQIRLKIPLHGLIYSKDNSLTYFIKRFDRYGKNKKISVEDFAQLAGKNRDTKYDYSMERLVKIIDMFCTFPVVEKVKLFKLTIFNFLIGNEDMHLKNFSLISKNGKIEFSPHYDLLNTTIAIKNVKEEIALPIEGKKNNLNKKNLIDYFGKELLLLNQKIINQNLDEIFNSKPKWHNLIEISFLNNEMKEKYYNLLTERWKRIFS